MFSYFQVEIDLSHNFWKLNIFYRLAVELHPTGEVTEYTATIGYEIVREGEEGRQKVDTVKMVLKAEGIASSKLQKPSFRVTQSFHFYRTTFSLLTNLFSLSWTQVLTPLRPQPL